MEIKIALRVYCTEESDLIESPWIFLFTNKRISERRAIIPSIFLGKIAILSIPLSFELDCWTDRWTNGQTGGHTQTSGS